MSPVLCRSDAVSMQLEVPRSCADLISSHAVGSSQVLCRSDAVAIAVGSSQVQHLCRVQKTDFCSIPSHPPTLIPFPSPLCCPLGLGEGLQVRCRAEHSMGFWTQHTNRMESLLMSHVVGRSLSQPRLRAALK